MEIQNFTEIFWNINTKLYVLAMYQYFHFEKISHFLYLISIGIQYSKLTDTNFMSPTLSYCSVR